MQEGGPEGPPFALVREERSRQHGPAPPIVSVPALVAKLLAELVDPDLQIASLARVETAAAGAVCHSVQLVGLVEEPARLLARDRAMVAGAVDSALDLVDLAL